MPEMSAPSGSPRIATEGDAPAAAALLDAFNAEFDTPTPGPGFLTARLRELIEGDGAVVYLGGEGPDAVIVLRVRAALWAKGDDAYIEEFYVRPERRGEGLGEGLLKFTIQHAQGLGVVRIELGTDEGDEAAHRLYEKLGFTNFTGEGGAERMLFFERDLE